MLRRLFVALALIGVLLYLAKASARDLGQWQYASPDMAAYFAGLKQPDAPSVPCCGTSDAYWADKTETGQYGELYAIITDTRDDGPLMRPHIDVGTRISVPPNKIRKPPIPNPTQHTIIFIGAGGTVYCYEPLSLM